MCLVEHVCRAGKWGGWFWGLKPLLFPKLIKVVSKGYKQVLMSFFSPQQGQFQCVLLRWCQHYIIKSFRTKKETFFFIFKIVFANVYCSSVNKWEAKQSCKQRCLFVMIISVTVKHQKVISVIPYSQLFTVSTTKIMIVIVFCINKYIFKNCYSQLPIDRCPFLFQPLSLWNSLHITAAESYCVYLISNYYTYVYLFFYFFLVLLTLRPM